MGAYLPNRAGCRGRVWLDLKLYQRAFKSIRERPPRTCGSRATVQDVRRNCALWAPSGEHKPGHSTEWPLFPVQSHKQPPFHAPITCTHMVLLSVIEFEAYRTPMLRSPCCQLGGRFISHGLSGRSWTFQGWPDQHGNEYSNKSLVERNSSASHGTGDLPKVTQGAQRPCTGGFGAESGEQAIWGQKGGYKLRNPALLGGP